MSSWLAALAREDEVAPGWIDLLAEPGGFRESLPFGVRAAATAPVPPEPDPVPVPIPEPVDPGAAAVERAYAEGHAAGRAAAEAEAQLAAERQRALRLAFRALDEAAMEVLADDLAETVITLCEATLAGCAPDRDALLARCQAAARRLGAVTDGLRLHLHPDDIATLGEEALAGWSVVADTSQARGGLMIEAPDGTVRDGPADWRRAIAAAVRG